MKKRRVFDEAFKQMAVELSHAKGSVQEAARELGIDSSRITKWRQRYKSPGQFATGTTALSEEQKLIKRLQKELKEAQLERDILKKAVGIFSRGDRAADRGKYSDL
ncbi:transposase [Spirosoma lituiforme]